MKLYVDDIRPAPENWVQAHTVTDAIKTISRFGHEIKEISLDHDISMQVIVDGTSRPFPSAETFQAVAYYIIKFWELEVAKGFPQKPTITIHTANPIGGKELELLLHENGFKTIVSPASRVNRLESEV